MSILKVAVLVIVKQIYYIKTKDKIKIIPNMQN